MLQVSLTRPRCQRPLVLNASRDAGQADHVRRVDIHFIRNMPVTSYIIPLQVRLQPRRLGQAQPYAAAVVKHPLPMVLHAAQPYDRHDQAARHGTVGCMSHAACHTPPRPDPGATARADTSRLRVTYSQATTQCARSTHCGNVTRMQGVRCSGWGYSVL